jgi:hypothetical protein
MFSPNQKVTCIYGKTWTVMHQIDNAVWVYGSNSVFHATKLFAK